MSLSDPTIGKSSTKSTKKLIVKRKKKEPVKEEKLTQWQLMNLPENKLESLEKSEGITYLQG